MRINNDHSLLDTRKYEINFQDKTYETMFATSISDNLLAQVDNERNPQMVLDKLKTTERGIMSYQSTMKHVL